MNPSSSSPGGWEEIEHDADIGLRVEAETEEALFRNAAHGMIGLLTDPTCVAPDRTRSITVEGADRESLLVGWLEDILWLFEVESFTPCSAGVVRLENGKASGQIRGERFDPRRHERRYAIKAVTWHNLEITRKDGVYSVSIIFDV